ncbi:MAG: hypothetical protein AAF658_19500, partial [Myxococcota bacterium]
MSTSPAAKIVATAPADREQSFETPSFSSFTPKNQSLSPGFEFGDGFSLKGEAWVEAGYQNDGLNVAGGFERALRGAGGLRGTISREIGENRTAGIDFDLVPPSVVKTYASYDRSLGRRNRWQSAGYLDREPFRFSAFVHQDRGRHDVRGEFGILNVAGFDPLLASTPQASMARLEPHRLMSRDEAALGVAYRYEVD